MLPPVQSDPSREVPLLPKLPPVQKVTLVERFPYSPFCLLSKVTLVEKCPISPCCCPCRGRGGCCCRQTSWSHWSERTRSTWRVCLPPSAPPGSHSCPETGYLVYNITRSAVTSCHLLTVTCVSFLRHGNFSQSFSDTQSPLLLVIHSSLSLLSHHYF